jgi:hypothetical protein
MCDGYRTAGEDDRPDLEDEFLCEYVDGTMDPVVRNVFEEYVRANPDLRDHIECLRHTRSLLCRYGCRCRAPRDLHDRLRREITCDLINGRIPFNILVAERLKGAASVSTAMAFVLLIGFLGGLTLMDAPEGAPTLVSAAVVSPQGSAASDRHVAPKPPTLMLRPRLSPRADSAPLRAGRTLVAKGLEQELQRGVPATYAAVGAGRAAVGGRSAQP